MKKRIKLIIKLNDEQLALCEQMLNNELPSDPEQALRVMEEVRRICFAAIETAKAKLATANDGGD